MPALNNFSDFFGKIAIFVTCKGDYTVHLGFQSDLKKEITVKAKLENF